MAPRRSADRGIRVRVGVPHQRARRIGRDSAGPRSGLREPRLYGPSASGRGRSGERDGWPHAAGIWDHEGAGGGPVSAGDPGISGIFCRAAGRLRGVGEKGTAPARPAWDLPLASPTRGQPGGARAHRGHHPARVALYALRAASPRVSAVQPRCHRWVSPGTAPREACRGQGHDGLRAARDRRRVRVPSGDRRSRRWLSPVYGSFSWARAWDAPR